MKECFVKHLENKTRVLVTHKFESLKYVDYIYIFKKGRIVEEGTLEELKDTQLFHEIEEKYKTMTNKEEQKEDIEDGVLEVDDYILEDEISTEVIEGLPAHIRMSLKQSITKEEIEKITVKEDKVLTDKLMLDEDREIGGVGWNVWKSYFNYYGGCCYFFIILLGK